MKNILYLLLSLIFFSCQPSNPESTEPDDSAIKDSIEKVLLAWSDQFENLNVEGIMEYMADDDEIIWASDGSIIKGRDDITDWMKDALSPIEKWNYTKYGKATIHPIGLDGAVYTVDFEESFTMSSGDTVVIRGVWTNVFKRSNGEWKVIHSASSHLAE
jgi:ketosteroid isomerase-like protein